MYSVLRTYSEKGANELLDFLEKKKHYVESVLRTVQGFVSYTLVRSDTGGFTVTVCRDKAGTDESKKKAMDWIAKNAADIGAPAPIISEGRVILHVTT